MPQHVSVEAPCAVEVAKSEYRPKARSATQVLFAEVSRCSAAISTKTKQVSQRDFKDALAGWDFTNRSALERSRPWWTPASALIHLDLQGAQNDGLHISITYIYTTDYV